MIRLITFGLVLAVGCGCALFFGLKLGASSAERDHQLRNSYLTGMNAIAAYSIQLDIAKAIEGKENSKALCLISLQASAEINKVRACMEDKSCKQIIESEVLKIAPEIIGHGDAKIKYYKEGEYCR